MRDTSSPPSEAAQPTKEPLFRRQAIEHQSTRQYGTVLLAHPFSHRFLTGLFIAIVSGIVAFFGYFETTSKAYCQGVLMPTAGIIKIVATQAGVITEMRAKEGQVVKAGEVLFVLSSERSSTNADSTERKISTLLRQRRDSFDAELKQSGLQLLQRMQAKRQSAKDFQSDIERIGDQVKLQLTRIGLAEQSYNRYGDLQATNYISAAQLQDKQVDLLDQRQRLADLQRAQSQARRDLLNVEAEMRDMSIQAERDAAALQRNVAAMDQDLTESEARREILVRAPHAGIVSAIAADPGRSFTAGSTLASVLPSGSVLEAEVYAPSRAIGFVKPGMQVLLRYQAYPYQKFGQYTARVTEVAHTAVAPQELIALVANSQSSEPMYRIRLKLDKQVVEAYGKQIPLKSGMLVDASIVVEHRKLYEWVLEPLFSISGRL